MRFLTSSLLLAILLCNTVVFGQSRISKTASVRPSDIAAVETLDQKIARVARFHHLDPRLFYSLISAESTFKPNAFSYKGAACYTQLMPPTARRFGLIVNGQIDERWNVEKCLNAGAQYLSWLLVQFKGDVRLALAGYNAGEGAVFNHGWKIPPYRETVQYVEKICALYYGQSGHGVAMAYNQPLAQTWAAALWRSWKPRANVSVALNAINYVPAAANAPQNAGQTPDSKKSSVVASEQESTVTKKTVTRVQLNESAPRLRTQSLSFY